MGLLQKIGIDCNGCVIPGSQTDPRLHHFTLAFTSFTLSSSLQQRTHHRIIGHRCFRRVSPGGATSAASGFDLSSFAWPLPKMLKPGGDFQYIKNIFGRGQAKHFFQYIFQYSLQIKKQDSLPLDSGPGSETTHISILFSQSTGF